MDAANVFSDRTREFEVTASGSEGGLFTLRIHNAVDGRWWQGQFESRDACMEAARNFIKTGFVPDGMEAKNDVINREAAENPLPGAQYPWRKHTTRSGATYWQLEVGAIVYTMEVLEDGRVSKLMRDLGQCMLREEDYPMTVEQAEKVVTTQMNAVWAAWGSVVMYGRNKR